MSHKNLTRLANKNTKFLSDKESNAKPIAMPSKGLLNKPTSGKIENNQHISVQLLQAVRKAMA
jgi:hypothetical protein